MAAQLGPIVNGIIVGNFISSHAMATVSACMPLSQITYALAVFLIPNSYALSIFLSSAEELRALVYDYLIVFVWRVPLYLMFFTWRTLIALTVLPKS